MIIEQSQRANAHMKSEFIKVLQMKAERKAGSNVFLNVPGSLLGKWLNTIVSIYA